VHQVGGGIDIEAGERIGGDEDLGGVRRETRLP
jgi:hypothetical protein